MFKHLFYKIAMALIFSSIQMVSAQSFTPQTGGVCYTLDIPDYMAKTFELNDAASLQYMNTQKEAYVIVIDDDKDQLEELGIKFSDIQEFFNNFTADYMVGVDERKLSELITFTSNGNTHAQAELSWKSDDMHFFMLITSIETERHYYKMLCWTVAESKDQLLADFKRISSSLQE